MPLARDPLPLDFGRDKPWCVYMYRDPRTRKREPIYVGKGVTETRPEQHWQHGSHNQGLNELLKELKKAGLSPVIELVGFFDKEADALEIEKKLILRLGSRSLATGPLFNRAPGGEGGRLPNSVRDPTPSSFGLLITLARTALSWSQQRLADKTRLGVETVRRAERGAHLNLSNRQALQRTLEAAGIEFIEDDDRPGLRIRREVLPR